MASDIIGTARYHLNITRRILFPFSLARFQCRCSSLLILQMVGFRALALTNDHGGAGGAGVTSPYIFTVEADFCSSTFSLMLRNQ